MTALPELEARLRTGLHAAAEALPPAGTDRGPGALRRGSTGNDELEVLAVPARTAADPDGAPPSPRPRSPRRPPWSPAPLSH